MPSCCKSLHAAGPLCVGSFDFPLPCHRYVPFLANTQFSLPLLLLGCFKVVGNCRVSFQFLGLGLLDPHPSPVWDPVPGATSYGFRVKTFKPKRLRGNCRCRAFQTTNPESCISISRKPLCLLPYIPHLKPEVIGQSLLRAKQNKASKLDD